MQKFSPIQYLMIDVASNFGLDKETWEARLQWFANNEASFLPMLAAIAQGKPIKGTLMAQAKEPALFFAGLKAWEKASRGEPTGYPISLDATASGAQIMAVLIGCEKSARFCNVVNTGNREDFYTKAHEQLSERVENPGKITRTMAKEAIVPWFYGSEAEPKEVFGEGAQLIAFKNTMKEEVPGINALRQALVDLWNPETLSHDWVLPDNFHVKIAVVGRTSNSCQFMNSPVEVLGYVNEPQEKGISNAANIIHSIDGMMVREMLRRCSYDAAKMEALLELLTCDKPLYKAPRTRPQDELVDTLWNSFLESGFLSARILELLDQDNLWMVDRDIIIEMITTLPTKPFSVLSVHDCFRVHPNYGNDLRAQYVQILHEISRSDMLAYIASQIIGEKQNVTKFGQISLQVLEAEYALS